MSTRDIQIRKAFRPAVKPEGVSTEAFLAEEDLSTHYSEAPQGQQVLPPRQYDVVRP